MLKQLKCIHLILKNFYGLIGINENAVIYLKEYIVVGGMPRVVTEFTNISNFIHVLKIQRNIVENYLEDMAKYADKNEKGKAREYFLSVPKQLSKDYKKFQYSMIEKKVLLKSLVVA